MTAIYRYVPTCPYPCIFSYKVLYGHIHLIYVNPTHVVSSRSVLYSLSYIVYTSETDQLFKFIFLYKVLYRRIRLIYANPTHVVSSQSVQYLLSYIVYTGETAFKQVNYLSSYFYAKFYIDGFV